MYRVELDQEDEEYAVVTILEYGGSTVSPSEGRAFRLRLMEDESLRIREKNADGWHKDDVLSRHMVWRKDDGEAMAGKQAGSNDAVAYLDALKSCTPGQFQFSAPGLGQSRNTVLGRVGDRCQVKIVHSRISVDCAFSDETIALLTSPQKYDDARTGTLAGSTDSEESDRVSRECKVQ